MDVLNQVRRSVIPLVALIRLRRSLYTVCLAVRVAQPQPQPTNNTAPTGSSQPRGGSPDGIASCVNKLLYKNAQVCTRTDVFSRCTKTELREVRSDISENVAVQA